MDRWEVFGTRGKLRSMVLNDDNTSTKFYNF